MSEIVVPSGRAEARDLGIGRWWARHPQFGDALLAVIMAAIATSVAFFVNDPDVADPTVPIIGFGLLSALPLIVRRRWPLVVLLVTTVSQAIVQVLHGVGAGWLGVVVAAYTVGAYVRDRRGTLAVAAWLLGLVMFMVLGAVDGELPWAAVPLNALLFGAAYETGVGMRSRRQQAAALRERAERAERERDLLAVHHAQSERQRIARELHDVVAHSLSVMVIQAAAARRQLAASPAAAEAALETIEATGRQAMGEMRHILGVLRDGVDGDASLTPQPSLDMLASLCAADPGLPVSLHVDAPSDALTPAVELSAYRVVQEALTNVRRHAGVVRSVSVRVETRADGLHIDVADDGRGSAADRSDGGVGLQGMRERVTAFGGEVTAGPKSGGGWLVSARIPVGAG